MQLGRALDWLVVATGTALVAVLAGIWASHLRYPYDLEWMEGGMLAHAWRLRRGLPIYGPPSPDFVPFVYPPGYSWLLAALGSLAPVDYPLGRAVSLAAALVAGVAVAAAVHRATRDRMASAWAGLAWLGAYPASGAFYDLVRPDALFVALAGLSVVLALVDAPLAAAGSGLLLAAATLCKQNAAALGIPLLAALLLRRRWGSAALFLALAAGPTLAIGAWLQATSDGWFLTYLVEVPRSHPWIWGRILPGLPRELAAAFPVALPLVALAAILSTARGPASVAVPVVGGILLAALGDALPVADSDATVRGLPIGLGAGALGALLVWAAMHVPRLRRPAERPEWRVLLLGGVLATALAITAPMRAHNGGYVNVYMPLHWAICAGFGVAAATGRARGFARPVAVAAGLQLAWQLASLDVAALTPTAADRAAGDALVERIRRAPPGPVFSPYAAWLPVRAGRDPSLSLIGLWDLEYEDPRLRAEATRVEAQILARRFPLVIDGTRPYGRGLGRAYRQEERLDLPEGVLAPRTGWDVRPATLWVPR